LLEALGRGREVGLSRNDPDFVKPGQMIGASLADPFVSRRPVRLAPGERGGVRLLVDPGGTAVVAGGRAGDSVEFSADELTRGVPIELAGRIVLLLHFVEREAVGAALTSGLLGESAGIRQVRRSIERVVDLPVSVLIRGETGTGKELVARALHDGGPRRGGPFVGVNLGALPRELATAELFGAARGSYTGATHDREGLFRAAQGGTLFLDELGEAPAEVQAMLLRVLETGEVRPVGAKAPVSVDARIVAATDADLEGQISDGRFKAPLLHRLAGYEIRLPPLRERREDIGALFYRFAHDELAALGEAWRLAPADPYQAPWLPAPLAARLLLHTWPGNVRQLRNWVRQLVIGSRGLPQLRLEPQLEAELDATAPSSGELAPGTPGERKAEVATPTSASPQRNADVAPTTSAQPPRKTDARPAMSGPRRRKAADVTEAELLEALRASAWDLKPAADRLNIPRPSIYDRIARSPNIRAAGDLGADEIERCFRECGGDVERMVERLSVSKWALGRRLRELGLTPRSRS
jgi:two-component system nitrogen regulation response regulator GlnG